MTVKNADSAPAAATPATNIPASTLTFPLRELPMGSVVRLPDGALASIATSTRRTRKAKRITVRDAEDTLRDEPEETLATLLYGPVELGRRALLALTSQPVAQAQLRELEETLARADTQSRRLAQVIWRRDVAWMAFGQALNERIQGMRKTLAAYMRAHGVACGCAICAEAREHISAALPEADLPSLDLPEPEQTQAPVRAKLQLVPATSAALSDA